MNDIVRYTVAALIAFGGIICIITSIKYNKIVNSTGNLPRQLPKFAGAFKHISQIILVFFIIGYIIGFFHILIASPEPMFYFVGVVFFVASFFVFFIIQYVSYLLDSLSNYNNDLRSEVEVQMHEMRHQDALLRAVNEAASILLASNSEDFGHSLWYCMGMLAMCVDVDRVYIWRNHTKDDILRCTQIYEWSEGAEPQQGNNLTVDISYDENIPGWKETLNNGQSINGPVSSLSNAEQEQLSPQGIISILVVPIFLQDEFWGFMGFDDCNKERDFSRAEEGILRSASLLIATCMLRNENNQALVIAKEAADRGSRAKSDFLSNMSHEIRTPLNAITGMSAIARGTDDMARVQRCLDNIDAASRQLLNLINDILDMSKIEAGKMKLVQEPFHLHQALYNIKSIIGVRATEKLLNFDLEIAPDTPEVLLGDELRLTQILLNLLSNAVKFTPEGGSVKLTSNLILSENNNAILRFDVSDTGIGISDEQQKRLFRAFEQAEKNTTHQYGGTGLGLAISKQFALMMGGDIEVVSNIGEGSCFTVRVSLPTGTKEMLNEKLQQGDFQDDIFTGHVILLAEDIEINREIVTTLLEERGAKIISAENGAIALELFAANPKQYDLILMDVQMPEMDGITATKKIRALPFAYAQSIPILAMTANAFDEDVTQCLAAGMNGHVSKPIDVKQLFQSIAQFLN